MKTKTSYAIGDIVKLVDPGGWYLKSGTVGVITDANCDSGSLEYAFMGCAWFTHDQFEFVSEATKLSVNKAIKSHNIDASDENE